MTSFFLSVFEEKSTDYMHIYIFFFLFFYAFVDAPRTIYEPFLEDAPGKKRRTLKQKDYWPSLR